MAFKGLLGGGEAQGDGEAAETAEAGGGETKGDGEAAEAGKEPAAGTILQKSFRAP